MTSKQKAKSGVIQAAGGLLWREGANGKQIAVVHRTRYDDWTLPKGWLEKGETFVGAAVREVMEETNCQVQAGEFAGCSCYLVESVPKIVLYWHMTLIGDCTFMPNQEVDELAWLTQNKAMSILTYEGEKELLAKAIKGQTPNG